jgi:mannose/fructose/N-acetylgalactosamine-specific phosphotransferase system component IID
LANGLVFLGSLIATAVVVAVAYSAAQDAHLPTKALIHQIMRRLVKLAVVLIVLALVVHFLSLI